MIEHTTTKQIAEAFKEGVDDALAGLSTGVTFDDDAESPRSRAYDHGRTFGESIADYPATAGKDAPARLVAAAPELYEALRAIVAILDNRRAADGSDDAAERDLDAFDNIVNLPIRDALAKADGR